MSPGSRSSPPTNAAAAPHPAAPAPGTDRYVSMGRTAEPGTEPVVQYPSPQAPPRGFAAGALIFAILGLVVSLFVGWGFPLGMVAIALAIVALRRPFESRGLAVWAIMLGAVSIVYSKRLASAAGLADTDLANLPWNPTDGGTYEKMIAHLTSDNNGKRGDEAGFDKTKVKVYGLGLDGGSGESYMRDVLREHGRLSPAQALVVLDPVLEALEAAHRAGFVHRDVKPENCLLYTSPSPRDRTRDRMPSSA